MKLSKSFVVVVATGSLAFSAACKSGQGESSVNPPPPPPPPTAVSTAASTGMAASGVRVGDAAPEALLKLHDGKEVSLSSLKGKHVVLYFYPKDDTPGCRIEAQEFRDNDKSLSSANISVFGVSLQDAASHQAFIDKEKLNFPLVVDDGRLAKAFGVPVSGEFASRQTFLIGPDGKLKKIWRKVSPEGHAEDVITAARSK